MIQYEIKADSAQVADAISLFEFVGGNTSDAIRVAINKTAPKIRTRASAAIRSQVRLKAAYVNERLTIRRATRQKLSGAISAPPRGTLLSLYEHGSKVSLIGGILTPENPIRVRVKPGGPIKPLKGGDDVHGDPFYIRLKGSGATALAMWRKENGPKGGRIKVFSGPSINQVFKTVRDDVLQEASDLYQNELLDAMRYLLQKKYPTE